MNNILIALLMTVSLGVSAGLTTDDFKVVDEDSSCGVGYKIATVSDVESIGKHQMN